MEYTLGRYQTFSLPPIHTTLRTDFTGLGAARKPVTSSVASRNIARASSVLPEVGSLGSRRDGGASYPPSCRIPLVYRALDRLPLNENLGQLVQERRGEGVERVAGPPGPTHQSLRRRTAYVSP